MAGKRRNIGPHEGTPEDDINAAQREQTALRLYALNYSYEEIAHRLSLSNRSAANKVVKRALHRMSEPEARTMRAKINYRCDWLQREVLELRMPPDVCNAAIAVDRFRASLLGLNLEPPPSNVQATQVVIQELPREMIEGV